MFSSTLPLKRLPSNETPDNDSGPKRLRSSTGGVSFKLPETMFVLSRYYCILTNEYDPKVLQQYRIPASKVTTDKMADGETT